MKTTATGKTYLEQFVGEFKKWANTHDIPYMDLGCGDVQDHFLKFFLWLNLFYLLDNYEVLHALEHTLDDCRIRVLYALVNLTKTQSCEILALLRGCADLATNLCDFQRCHCTSKN